MRISRRAVGALVSVVAAVLLVFAYGGYRRGLTVEAEVRGGGAGG